MSAHNDVGHHFVHVHLVASLDTFSFALLVLVRLVQNKVIGSMSSGL